MKKTIAILFALLFCLLAAVMTAGAEGELSDVPQFDSTEAVAAFIRTEMVSRSAEIRFKATDEAVAAVTLADVCEHTGNGTEGDYLRLALNYALPQIEKGADGVFVLRPTYYTTAEQEAAVGAYAESALAGCTAEDDAQTARYIYDYLCENVAFDLENLYNEEDLLKYTAYGAAVNGKAVCQGFATLYYRLALAAGLDCRIVTGARGDIAHAWNIVKIDDQWYHLDASSGAQLLDNSTYFMKRLFDGYTIHYGNETAPEIQGYLFVIGNDGENIQTGTLNGELNYGYNDSIVWQLNNKTGALVITGTGEMPTILFQNGTPFWNNTNIKSVVISEGITNIADYLFNGCSKLAEISIPSTVTSIGSTSFSMCPIESIYLGEGNPVYCLRGNCLIHIASKTLLMGTSNSVIPNDGSVESITTCAFYGCSNLKTIVFPDSLKTISGSAFRDCTGLTELQFPTGLTTIGGGSFYGCTGLTELSFPAGLTYIGNEAFYGCTGLTELRIPAGITSIRPASFQNCSGLQTISFSDWEGQKLDICDNAFYGCTGLTEVNLPQGTNSINNYSFSYCTELTKLTLPESVNKIESTAFYGCGKLESITVDSENPTFHSYNNCLINTAKKELIAACYNSVIPDDGSVTRIGVSAFSGCETLTSIEIPSSITAINGFSDCTGLTEVTIPASVESISSAFNGCTGLTELNIVPGVVWIFQSFENCTGLTTLSFPNTLTSIDGFSGCNNLISITFSEGLKNVSGFHNCIKLSSFNIPTTLGSLGHPMNGNTVFNGCNGLTSLEIPNGVGSILGFSECKNLTSVTIPESVTYFSSSSFSNCSKLKSVIILSHNASIYIPNHYTFQYTNCTIYGFSGSWAETFAQDNNKPFIPLCPETSTPHNTQPVDVTEPDCLTPGYSAGTVCLDCGEWLSGHEQTAEALGHTAGEPAPENVVAATCTAEGSYDNVTRCTRCGELLASTPEKIAMLPHADDDHNGYCDECGAYICEHPETALQNAKTVSCTENGYSGDTVCSWCGVTLEYGVTLQAPGHSLAISMPAKNATCLEPGMTAEYTCSACGGVTTAAQQTPIADHADGDGDGLCDVCFAPTDCANYGRCGDDLFWYAENGVLVISGSGETGELNAVPWESCADSIDCVYLRDSVTAMDGAPFAACPNLERVFAAAGTTVSGCEAPVLYYADANGVVTVSARGDAPALDLPALLNAADVLCTDRTVTSICFARLSLCATDGGQEIVYDILKRGKIIDERHFRLPSGTVLSAFSMKPLSYASFNSAFVSLAENPDRNLILSLSCEDLLPESLKSDSQSYTEQFVLHFVDEPEKPTEPEQEKKPALTFFERFQATLAAILSVFKKLFKIFKK